MNKWFFLVFMLIATHSGAQSSIDKVADDELIAATLILEAGGERHPYSMVAVYEVIRNRATQRNQTMREVVLARKQFSCWNNVERRMELFEHATRHIQYPLALKIVREKKDTNITRGATHYHAVRVNPYWATSYTETITIQNHIFYR